MDAAVFAALFFTGAAFVVGVALRAAALVAVAWWVEAVLAAAFVVVDAGADFLVAALEVGAVFVPLDADALEAAAALVVVLAVAAVAAFATRAVVELREGARLAAAVVLALAVSTIVPRPSLPQRSAVRARTGAARISAARGVLNGKTRNFRNTGSTRVAPDAWRRGCPRLPHDDGAPPPKR
ncbi:hypothetical protein ACFUC1_20405, partial [Pedococcus sp. NPDC057267]|uniref:hypothetical protein n=1 Tax=Pedococcus sp. NPDC057267 TaxID=3346077 RepID=UPI00363E9408